MLPGASSEAERRFRQLGTGRFLSLLSPLLLSPSELDCPETPCRHLPEGRGGTAKSRGTTKLQLEFLEQVRV